MNLEVLFLFFPEYNLVPGMSELVRKNKVFFFFFDRFRVAPLAY